MVTLVERIRAAIAEDPGSAGMTGPDWDLDWTAVSLCAADIFLTMVQKPVNGSDPGQAIR